MAPRQTTRAPGLAAWAAALAVAWAATRARAGDGRRDRGDVPGWVLVTMMTAGLVVLLWGVAGPALTGLFDQAIQSVSGL